MRLLPAARLALTCLLGLTSAFAQVNKTWNGSISTDWFDPNNWTPPGIPAANDTVNLASGTINLTAPVSVPGQFNWSGGTLSGSSLSIGSGGVMNITGSVTLQNVLTNAGTVTMSGPASVSMQNNNASYRGGVYNLAGGLWDIQTNANINCYFCSGAEFFNNAGVLRKSQGSGTGGIGVNFTNTGTVNALAGILSFNAGFTTVGGTLAFGVSGLSTIGQINVSGNVALNGTASVAWLGGFMPAIGNSFGLLSYGSHSGTFANITLPPGTTGQGNYGATVFSLLITGTNAPGAPPVLSIEKVNASTVMILWPTSAVNFGLQTNASLSSVSWSNVISGITTVGTNYVLTNPVNGSAAFFRLHSQ